MTVNEGHRIDIKPKYEVAAVTICATNYIGKALVLRESYLALHPESDFYILIIERKHNKLDGIVANNCLLWAEDLGIDNYLGCAMKFDVIELSTNVKAATLAILLQHYNAVLYLDPDICFYGNLDFVFQDLKLHSIVVTPHTMTPIMDGKIPSDIDFLRNGTFNLGFVGIGKCDEAFRFLDWWSQRCLEFGFYEPQSGLAVDQKWIDLAFSFFPGMKVLRDPGLNVAYWNLHERVISRSNGIWLVNGKWHLRFFHFSSFNPEKPHAIGQKQSRFAEDSRSDLHELLDSYAINLREKKNELYSSYAYCFNHFEDGMYVTPSLRRVYAALESTFPLSEDPFSPGSSLQQFAITHGLAGRKYKMFKQPTFKEIGDCSKSVRVISIGLRYVLRVIGPNRYFVLMRYLSYISSIRNQSDVFLRR